MGWFSRKDGPSSPPKTRRPLSGRKQTPSVPPSTSRRNYSPPRTAGSQPPSANNRGRSNWADPSCHGNRSFSYDGSAQRRVNHSSSRLPPPRTGGGGGGGGIQYSHNSMGGGAAVTGLQNGMAIGIDHQGVMLKSQKGAAIRMRQDGLDLSSSPGGQTLSVNTATRGRFTGGCGCTGGGCTRGCTGGGCNCNKGGCGCFSQQQNYYNPCQQMQPIMAASSYPIMAAPIAYPQHVTYQQPMQVAQMQQIPMATAGRLHNMGGVPVVIPVQRRF